MLPQNFLLSFILPFYKNYIQNKMKRATFVAIRYFININMHFFKTYDRFPFWISSKMFELLSEVRNVFIASLTRAY